MHHENHESHKSHKSHESHGFHKCFIKWISCWCCFILVVTNVAAMILGILLAIIGIFFTFGFSMFSSVLESVVTSATASLTSMLKTNMSIDIDVYALLKNIGSVFGSMGAALMIIGIIVLVLACFGCCGACCKHRTCLVIYAAIVGLIFLAQVIIVIMWFTNASMFKQSVKTAMEESLKEYSGLDSKNIQSLLQNLIQIFVGCCGVNNGTDFYSISTKWNKTYTMTSSGYNYTFNMTYPVTCCKFNTTSFQPVNLYCPYNNTNTNTSNYQTGCYSQIFTFVDGYFRLDIIFYILAGILGYQALLILGAIILHRECEHNSSKVKPG